jgi:CHAT domain-containing protein
MISHANIIRPYENYFLSVFLSSTESEPGFDYSRLAFNGVLNQKGKVLFALSQKRQNIFQNLEPADKKILDELQSVNNMIANIAFNPSFNQSSAENRDLIDKLETRANNLEALLYKSNEDFQSLKSEFSYVTIDLVQKTLPRDSALVEFIVYQPTSTEGAKSKTSFFQNGASRYAAYILFPDGKTYAIDLGPAQAIEQSFSSLRDDLRDRNTPIPQFQKSARDLDKLVMQPIRQRLGNTRNLFLSPDSILNLLPFEALVDEQGRYLLETYNFTYLTSGRDLLRLQNTKSNSNPVLVLADPFFDKISPTLNTRALDLAKQSFPPLQQTAAEANEIGSLFKVQPLLGIQATETAIKQAKSPSILHIATHGFFQTHPNFQENPLLHSGLVFAGFKGGKSGNDDGILTALEVSSLNLSGTKLVTLSACDTGLGSITNGEGIYGLRRALVIAEAESQVISLWKVADDATKDLMINYYTRLKGGEGRSTALHQAQRDMLKSGKYSHPYYWAAFIPSGDWRSMSSK